MRKVLIFLGLIGLIFTSSCSKDENSQIIVSEITINPTSVTLQTGDTITIAAITVPSGNSDEINWTSQNKLVASINENGKIRALASGQTTVTATIGDVSVVCSVNVNPSIYATGRRIATTGKSAAVAWRNGKFLYTLSDTTYNAYGEAIALDSDNDIYIAGHLYNGTIDVPYVWEDRDADKLGTTGVAGSTTSIFLSGGDVFVGGTSNTGKKDIATIWKDDTPIFFTDGTVNSTINSVFVYNGAIYATGFTYSGTGKQMAAMWKNGVITTLSNGVKDAAGESIFISGGNVYIGGYDGNGAVIWKNGEKSVIAEPANGAKVLCIYISGSNIYAVGYVLNASYAQIATLWNNGSPTTLSTNSAVATSVFVLNNNVYVGGFEYNADFTRSAIVWTNGVGKKYGAGEINSIFVK